MNEIKAGDIVFLIHPANVNTLEINKPYKVYHKYCDFIAIEDDFVDDYDGCNENNLSYNRDSRYNYYNEKKFKKDIRFERKLKLLQISKIRNNLSS